MKFLLALTLASASLIGCSGASDVPMPEESDEGALERNTQTARALAKAVAIEMDVTPTPRGSGETVKATVALPATVKKIINMKKTRESATSEAACNGYKANLRFLDEKGEQIAKSQLVCDVGVLDLPDTATQGVKLADGVDLLKIAKADRVPADALWGITSVEVNRPRERDEKKVTDADAVKKMVDAIKGDQAIDKFASMPRCLPTYSIAFKRGEREVAYTSFICNPEGDPGATASARFSIAGANADADPIIQGAITLDPRPFVGVFSGN